MKEHIKRIYTDLEKPPIYIDTETGEIKDYKDITVYIQTEEEKERAREYFKNLQGKKEKQKFFSAKTSEYGEFVWAVYSLAKELLPEIKPSNLTRLMYLSTFIGYDGYICKNKSSPMNEDDITDCLGLSYGESRKFISEMYEHKILLERDDKIYVNREFFTRGGVTQRDIAVLAKKKMVLTRLYIDAVRDLYKKATSRSHKTLSYIFQVIPFVNREYNIVCRNPLETELEKVQPMTLGEFCDVIGYDKANAYKLYHTLFEPQFECGGKIRKAMRYVVSNDLNKNSFCMFINPRVYYAGSKLEYVEVLGQF